MRKQSQSGFMLIEVLISVLIFSVGVIALVGLQGAMTHAQTEAKARADASYLASELMGLMWADISNIGSYNSANCSGYPQCNTWLKKVQQALPSSATLPPSVSVDTSNAATQGDVLIVIKWQLPNGSPHQFTTRTSVRVASS